MINVNDDTRTQGCKWTTRGKVRHKRSESIFVAARKNVPWPTFKSKCVCLTDTSAQFVPLICCPVREAALPPPRLNLTCFQIIKLPTLPYHVRLTELLHILKLHYVFFFIFPHVKFSTLFYLIEQSSWTAFCTFSKAWSFTMSSSLVTFPHVKFSALLYLFI